MSETPTHEPRGLFAAWARLVTARPLATLLITLLLSTAGLLIALQIKPATSVQDMLADDQPSAVALGKVVGNYALVDDLIVLARLPMRNSGSDPDRLIGFAERLEQELADDPMVASLRYRSSEQAAAFIEEVVIPHGLYYLDEDQRAALQQRLTRAEMDEQFAQNAAMLAAPGPAAGRLAKELIRDPLRLRDFLSENAGQFASGGGGEFMEGTGAMVSRDGGAIMIRIMGRESAGDLNFTAAFMPRIREAAAAANPNGELRIDYTGAYAIAELSASQTRADMIRSCTGSILLLVVVFIVVYRHPMAFWLLKLPVYAAIITAFGVYGVLSGRLTPVTAVAGAVLAGLGIDYCVHVLSHHEAVKRSRKDGDDRAAGVHTVAAVGPAVMAACVTSLIGFGAVLSSSVQSLREFALLGMLGLGLALLASITVLPALLATLGPTRFAKHGLSSTRFDLAPTVRHVARHPKRYVWLSALVIVAAGFTVVLGSIDRETGWHSPLAFDSDLHALHPRPHPPLDTQETLAEVFGAAQDSLMILVEGDSPDWMLSTAYQVQNLFPAGETLPSGVAGALGPATLLPTPSNITLAWSESDVQRVIDELRASADAAGFNAAAFGETEDFLRTLLTSDAPKFDDLAAYPELAGMVLPRDQEQPSEGLVLVTLTRPWMTVSDRDATIEAAREKLSMIEMISSHHPPKGTATLTGITVVGYDTQQAIGDHLTKLLLIAAGLVLAWLLIFFRRPGDLVLALLPSFAGVLALVTCAEVFGWTLNAINLIAMPLVVGIGVDDGIFLVAIARRCRKLGENRKVLIDHLAASAHAITMTSVTTGLAFGSLAFTSVPAIRSLGWFTAMGVGAAWAASVLTLLPVLILLYPRKSAPATLEATTP
ncbi:MAG: MMPL family transporter [Planctomycetota bacterium]